MYCSTFTSFIIGTIITHEFLRQYYPEEYKSMMYIIGYNSLYLFSKFQIFFNKFYKNVEIHIVPLLYDYSQKVYPFLEEIGLKEKMVKKDIKLIKNGVTTKFFERDELEFLKRLKEHFEGTFDIIVFTDYENIAENGKLNKVIYNEIPDNLDYKVAQTSFILSEIVISENGNDFGDNVIYKIDFSNDKYNYFVVGNQFCRHFVKYFLRKHYNHVYKEHLKQINENNYMLKIIDNNVNMLDLCKMKVLKINDDGCNVDEFKEKEYRVYEEDMFPRFKTQGIINVLEESNCTTQEEEKNDASSYESTISRSCCSMDDSYVKL